MSRNKKSDNTIYGIHTVETLLQQQPESVIELWVAQDNKNRRIDHILASARMLGLSVQAMPNKTLTKLLATDKHQNIAARIKPTQHQSGDYQSFIESLTEPAFLLILDNITDPHNLGACLRTADAAGVDAVLAPKHQQAPLSATARKVASGAAELTPYFTVSNLATAMKWLQQQNIWLTGTSDKAEQSVYEADLTCGLAIVMGAEDKGMRRLTADTCDSLVHIPMHGGVSSLNVSVAAGVCLFEAVRQRRGK